MRCWRSALVLTAAVFQLVVAADTAAALDRPQRQAHLFVSPRTLTLLTDALRSQNPRLRVKALRELGNIAADSTFDEVTGMLEDPLPRVRATALEVLSEWPTPPKPQLIERACEDPSADVVRQALYCLAYLPDSQAVGSLVRVGPKLDESARHYWAHWLSRQSVAPPANVTLELISDPSNDVAFAGAEILAKHPGLLKVSNRVELVKHPHPAVRKQAIASLTPLLETSDVYEVVLSALDDQSHQVQRAALKALEAKPPSTDTLKPFLHHPDSSVRIQAIKTTAQTDGSEKIELIVDRFADVDVLAARQAVAVLGTMDKAAVSSLVVPLLNDSRDQVVVSAARTLGKLGQSELLASLRPLVDHPSKAVRTAVYQAMGDIGDSIVVELLLERAAKENHYVRAAANRALGQIGDLRALPHLLDDLHHPDEKSKGIDPRQFTPLSQPAPYPREDTAVATSAVVALGLIGDPETAEAVAEVHADLLRDTEFWTAIAECMGKFDRPVAKDVLKHYSTVGVLVQGMATLVLPNQVRIRALRIVEQKRYTDLVPDILNMTPIYCRLPVRNVAAEVLTGLTGKPHRANLPSRVYDAFLADVRTNPPAPKQLPVCRLVDESGK